MSHACKPLFTGHTSPLGRVATPRNRPDANLTIRLDTKRQGCLAGLRRRARKELRATVAPETTSPPASPTGQPAPARLPLRLLPPAPLPLEIQCNLRRQRPRRHVVR